MENNYYLQNDKKSYLCAWRNLLIFKIERNFWEIFFSAWFENLIKANYERVSFSFVRKAAEICEQTEQQIQIHGTQMQILQIQIQIKIWIDRDTHSPKILFVWDQVSNSNLAPHFAVSHAYIFICT